MRLLALPVLSIAVATGAFAEPLASFEPLGTPYSDAHEVSADGASVVGGTAAPGAGVATAFRWTSEGGMTRLTDGGALGASADGSVVVGEMDSPGHSEAFRWTAASGAIGLGFLPGDVDSVAFDTSADGSVVVGYSIQSQAAGWRATAFRWTEEGGMVDLGPSPGGAESLARGVSADGSVIVGELRSPGRSEAFLWRAGSGIVGLWTLPNAAQSIATDVSADGSVVVGTTSPFFFGARAFRWSADRGMQELPFAHAYSASADGSVIVGAGYDGRAVIWTASGVQPLIDLLRDYGLDPGDWRLDRATGVSDDGLVIVGWGSSASAGIQSWKVSLAVAECDNGLDDDGDGISDFPDDPGCASPSDLSERGTPTCDNGFDEDGDGVADIPADPGCVGPTDDSERGTGICDNGLDEDGDGKTDRPDDPGCADPGDESELSEIQCDNGQDDDRDGRIDWRSDDTGDPKCFGLRDPSEERPQPPPGGCGFGPELAVPLAALWWRRSRVGRRDPRHSRA